MYFPALAHNIHWHPFDSFFGSTTQQNENATVAFAADKLIIRN